MKGTIPQNLTRRIVDSLGQAIVTGDYGPDAPFPIEAQLCTQFEASRSVVREAVKMLTAKGLLSARPRRGTVVEPESRWNLLDPDVLRWLLDRKFSLKLLAEFTQMRQAFEPAAASLAAQRADIVAIERIAAALGRMDAAAQGHEDPLESDIAFHVAILDASGNRFFAQMRGLINTALSISIHFTNRYKGVRSASVPDHRRVLDAIAAGNAAGAERAMQAMLDEVMQLIEAQAARHRRATA